MGSLGLIKRRLCCCDAILPSLNRGSLQTTAMEGRLALGDSHSCIFLAGVVVQSGGMLGTFSSSIIGMSGRYNELRPNTTPVEIPTTFVLSALTLPRVLCRAGACRWNKFRMSAETHGLRIQQASITQQGERTVAM